MEIGNSKLVFFSFAAVNVSITTAIGCESVKCVVLGRKLGISGEGNLLSVFKLNGSGFISE